MIRLLLFGALVWLAWWLTGFAVAGLGRSLPVLVEALVLLGFVAALVYSPTFRAVLWGTLKVVVTIVLFLVTWGAISGMSDPDKVMLADSLDD